MSSNSSAIITAESSRWRATARVLRLIGAASLGRLTLAALAGATAEAAAIALMSTATWMIVRAAAQPPIAALGLAIVGVRAFALARPVLRYLERLAGHDSALAALVTLRERVYAALARSRPGRLPGGDVLSRVVSDVDAVQDLLLRCLLPAVIAVGSGALAIVLCWLLYPTAGALLLAGLFLAIVVVPLATYGIVRRFAVSEARVRAQLARRSLDLIDGAAELSAYGADHIALAAADGVAHRLARIQRATAHLEAVATATTLAIQAATTLSVLIVSTHHDVRPILIPVLTLTCLTAFEPTMLLPLAARQLITVTAASQRLVEVFDTPPEIIDPAHPHPLDPGPVTVDLHDVRVRYSADRPPALDRIRLHIGPGQRIAVVGPSGSGKSTLLAALARQVDHEAGTVTVNGHDVRTLATDDVRARLIGATQDAYVFHASLRDNLMLARPAATPAELTNAVRRARLQDWIETLPAGLDTVVGHDGASMSGGQRRRLVLARALLSDPDVLLLDEPLEGLDAATAGTVWSETLAATRGKTTVLVTHRLAGLDTVDQIIVLDQGRIAQRGRHADLVAVPGRYRELWCAEQLADRVSGHVVVTT
jgi:ATP-binding cassette subfamily C protein/ATP-binding cassette subfamily C protein CydC